MEQKLPLKNKMIDIVYDLNRNAFVTIKNSILCWMGFHPKEALELIDNDVECANCGRYVYTEIDTKINSDLRKELAQREPWWRIL